MQLFSTAVVLFSMFGLWAQATQWIPSVGGPFKVVLRHYDSCPEEIRGLDLMTFTNRDSGCSWSKFQKCVDVNITTQIDLTTEVSGILRIASWSTSGGWKDNAHVIKYPNTCHGITVVLKGCATLITNQIFGEFQTCPFLKGFYRFFDYKVHSFSLNMIKHFFYGKWRVDAQAMRKNGEIVGCVRIFADTVPDMDAIKNNKWH